MANINLIGGCAVYSKAESSHPGLTLEGPFRKRVRVSGQRSGKHVQQLLRAVQSARWSVVRANSGWRNGAVSVVGGKVEGKS